MAHTKNMITYIIKRVLLIFPIMLLILLVTFTISTFMSQNSLLNALPLFATPEQMEAERIRVGYYDPWYIKVAKYFAGFFTGDWGTSYVIRSGVPVYDLIVSIFPKTIELVIIPVIIIPILSVKLGVSSAKNRNNWKDTIVRGFMMIGVCLPVFWLATLLQYFFGTIIPNFTYGALDLATMSPNGLLPHEYKPITGFRLIDGFISGDQILIHDTLLHLILPDFCLIIVSLAGITRLTRASMLEVMQKDYIRTARAKGVPDREVTNKHTLRNALIPTSTAIVGTVAALLTGSLFIEISFNYTGMGYYMIEAITYGDYVVINGILVFTSIIILVGVIVSDVLYTIIDPRIIYK